MDVGRALLTQKHLHSLVYLVADRPGKDNVSSSIPLVGTKSYKTLLNWCADMHIDVTRMRMYNQSDNPFAGLSGITLNNAIKAKHVKVIALGTKAAKYLLKVGITDFFVLPHPSGRNRKLNDKEFVAKTLEECKGFIYGE